MVSRSYCTDHQPTGWKSGGYSRTSTTEHRRWRAAVLELDQFVCQLRSARCVGTATEADHVIPVAEGGPEFDPANGQAACGPCHDLKSQRYATARAKRARRAAPPGRIVGRVATNPGSAGPRF